MYDVPLVNGGDYAEDIDYTMGRLHLMIRVLAPNANANALAMPPAPSSDRCCYRTV